MSNTRESAISEQVCEVFMPTDHPNGPGHYCELPAVIERDGKPVCEAHRYGVTRWRYWLFGFIPLRGSTIQASGKRRGPHIWRYLGTWRPT